MKEYLIEIKVRNNLILSKVKEKGYDSIPKFCKAHNITYTTVIKYISLKESPLNKEGKWKETVEKLCNALGCIPENLFSESQMNAEIKNNKRTLEVGEAEVQFFLNNQQVPLLPDESIEKEEMTRDMLDVLKTLTPRERVVLYNRFGLHDDEKSLRETGALIGVTQERVRQIEAKALRKLRHPSRSEKLHHYIKE